MKYSYEGADNRTLIKKYVIRNNRIIVKYFGNKIKSYNYSEENEKKIQDIMIEQAIIRDRIVKDIKKYGSFKHEILLMEFETFLWLFTISNLILSREINNSIIKLLSYLVASYNALLSGYICNNYFSKVDKNEELLKYRKYLSMRHLLKEYINNKDLLKDIIHRKDILNINNLDRYTLVEIEQLEENLDNIRKKIK